MNTLNLKQITKIDEAIMSNEFYDLDILIDEIEGVKISKEYLNLEVPNEIYEAFLEIQKPRTNFQLEKFVVGQHDLPEQQYKQTLLEIQQLIFNLKSIRLELKKTEIEIARLRATKDEIDEVDAQIKEIGQERTKLALVGAIRELKDLIEIWKKFPVKFTYQQLEQSEPDYWDKRLTRQAALEHMGSDGKIGWASLDALRQIGSLDKVIMDESQMKKEIS